MLVIFPSPLGEKTEVCVLVYNEEGTIAWHIWQLRDLDRWLSLITALSPL